MSLNLPACELGDHGRRPKLGPIEVQFRVNKYVGDLTPGEVIETNTCAYCLAEARDDDRLEILWSSADD